MIGSIAHVGITVRDMEKSILFYRDVLGLELVGDMKMQGIETERLTQIKGAKLRVVYFNSNKDLKAPPIELIEFIGNKENNKPYEKISNSGISEICFYVDDIDKIYQNLKEKGVEFLSSPQLFDLTNQGYGKSKAVYFRDNNGIVLELIEYIN